MPKYTVHFFTEATFTKVVEADDEDEAYELAAEEQPDFPYLRDIDFNGEWELFHVEELEDDDA